MARRTVARRHFSRNFFRECIFFLNTVQMNSIFAMYAVPGAPFHYGGIIWPAGRRLQLQATTTSFRRFPGGGSAEPQTPRFAWSAGMSMSATALMYRFLQRLCRYQKATVYAGGCLLRPFFSRYGSGRGAYRRGVTCCAAPLSKRGCGGCRFMHSPSKAAL